ncbi:MAG TPA: CoA pyrophosphatase [Gemmatimonadaceae bacterium]|nr:CoA pyrophosphatase [Gemmatimonadaceae bacterium]
MNAGASASARLAHIISAVRSHAPTIAERDGVYFEAAVALVLRETPDDQLELLFIKRAARADDPWSGQIAFPGGRRDAIDASLEETALRETREEVGFDLLRDGTIIGALDESRPRIPVLPPVIVRPFVATIAFDATGGPSDEVEEYFWAPLAEILDPTASRITELPVKGNTVLRPAIHYAGNVIWGMTEGILRRFEEITR